MKALFKLIESIMDAGFYGELRIKFQGGRVSHIEKEESLDISEMRKEKP
jgi:hypothetical protein